MHLILTGATGTVGIAVLQHALASPAVTQLSILSRRDFALPTGAQYDTAKARVFVQSDFTTYEPAVLEALRGAHGCVWAQGISQTEVNKEEYVRITYDYPMAAARAFAGLAPAGFNFVYVSGEGADPNEKSYTLFGKIKGRAESHLLALPPPLRAYNVRPGYVDPSASGGFHRPRGLVHRLTDILGPVFRATMPSMVSPTAELAGVLVDLALGDGKPLPQGTGIEAGGRTVRSSAIRRWHEVWGAEQKRTEL